MKGVSDWHLDEDSLIMQKRTLELRKYAAQFGMGRTTVDSFQLDAMRDFQTDTLIYRIQMDILSDKIAEDTQTAKYSYELYTTPWQMFKDWYMPEWFKQRFPVKRTTQYGKATVTLKRYATYPKANIALQKDKKFFEVMLGGHEAIHDEVTIGTLNER